MEIAEEKAPLFTKTDLNKLIRPLIVEQLLAITVGMLDTMMVSSLSDAAVSGVSVSDMISVLMINIFSALATGGSVICAHAIGLARTSGDDREYEYARRGVKHLLVSLLSVSMVVAVICYVLRVQIFGLIFSQKSEKVLGFAVTYFAINTISFPFLALYNGFAAIFRIMGNSRITMITSAITNVINLLGNALFIYVFELGVAGAAWSTLIARAVGAIIMFIVMCDKSRPVYINFREKFNFDFDIIRRMLRIGIPSGLENGTFQLGRILVITMIAGFSTAQLTANAIAANFDTLGSVPGHAFAIAIVTVVGQAIGAGDYNAALDYVKKLVKKCYAYAAVLEVAIILTLPLTLQLYSASYEALKIAWILIVIHNGFAIFLWPLAFVLPGALRAAKDVRFTMIVASSSMVCFRIVFSYIFGVICGLGIIGIWIAMLFDWIFRAIFFVWRIKSGRWLSKLNS